MQRCPIIAATAAMKQYVGTAKAAPDSRTPRRFSSVITAITATGVRGPALKAARRASSRSGGDPLGWSNAAAIASLLRLSIQVGMPSTGNPVSTDFPLSSILISTI